jgi:hypothetical protein
MHDLQLPRPVRSESTLTAWPWLASIALGALVLASPERAGDTPRSSQQQADSPLTCSIETMPGRATGVTLGSAGGARLAAGQRVAWSTLGTPAPTGGIVRLAVDLTPGATWQVPMAAAVHGSGCVARLVP